MKHPREHELEWEFSTQNNQKSSVPDETWPIPSDINPYNFAGYDASNLKKLEVKTNTFMNINHHKNHIEIWGNSKNLKKALKQLQIFADTLTNTKSYDQKKPKKNYKQTYKIQEHEEKSKDFLFNEDFVFLYANIFIPQRIENILDQVRTKTKCQIRYDPKSNVMTAGGNSSESVKEAMAQITVLFIKEFNKSVPEKSWVSHMVDPPHKPYNLRIADPPSSFYLPYNEPMVKLLEPVYNIEDDVFEKSTQNSYFDNLQIIRESNIKRFEDDLVKAFEAIHLFDGEIKMRIRFGHICMTRCSKELLTFEEFINEKPTFATCLAKEKHQLDNLFKVLSAECSQGLDGSPFREFKIQAIHKKSDYDQALNVQFEKFINNKMNGKNGKFGLWNAFMNEKTVLDVNMSCFNNDYSWRLQLQAAKILNNKSHTRKIFIDSLRLCDRGRLIYSNTEDIRVVSICEKTKWKYLWDENYVVEITKYEFWNLSNYKNINPGFEIYLSQKPSPIVSYGVALYKKSWEDAFALNKNLKFGIIPEWHPHNIIYEEGAEVLLNDIQKFLRELQSSLPMPTKDLIIL